MVVNLSGLWIQTSCFLGCSSAVRITLKNDIREYQGGRAGTYERSTDVNGKPSYMKDDDAIWYDRKDHWVIGSVKNLGDSVGGIKAKDDFEGLTDENNVWNYADDEWKPAGTNDITVECTSGTPKFLLPFLHLWWMN